MVPNHRILEHNFLEIFYQSRNVSSKAMEATITREAFMNLR